MKVPNVYKKYGKKAVALTIAGICILVAILVAGMWFLKPRKQSGTGFPQNMSDMFSGLFGTESTPLSGTGSMVTASGITSVGIIQENFEVENLSQGILIEEVFVSSGQEIAEGDTVLKLSEASVAEAREELEDLLKDADLAYRTGIIEYEQSLITAKYNRDQAVLSGKQAQEIYNETVASLTDSVAKAKEQLAQTKDQIAEYEALTANNDYYNTYKVGEYKALYDENLELLKSRMEEWNVSWEQVLSGAGSMGGQSSMGSQGGIGNQGGMGDLNGMGGQSGMGSQGSASAPRSVSGGNAVQLQPQSDPGYTTALRALYSVLEQNLQDYEQALADYEDASANAKLTLQTLKLSLSSLEQNLTQAQINYDSQYLQAKVTLENTLAEVEQTVSISVGLGQKVIYAQLTAVRGNEITYTVAKAVDTEELQGDINQTTGGAGSQMPWGQGGQRPEGMGGQMPWGQSGQMPGGMSGQQGGAQPQRREGGSNDRQGWMQQSFTQGQSGGSTAQGGFPGGAFSGGEFPGGAQQSGGFPGGGREGSGFPGGDFSGFGSGSGGGFSDFGGFGAGMGSGSMGSTGSSADTGFTYNNVTYQLTRESVTTQIPVGTEVITRLGTVTAFSRLAAGDCIALVVEEEAGTQIIMAVYIIG